MKAIESVAKRLGNTKAVCRKCYIHPAILDAYMDGATIQTIKARALALGDCQAGADALRKRRSSRIDRARGCGARPPRRVIIASRSTFPNESRCRRARGSRAKCPHAVPRARARRLAASRSTSSATRARRCPSSITDDPRIRVHRFYGRGSDSAGRPLGADATA